MLPKVLDISPMLGCDPEFFFKQNGEIVGAEKFIPKEGISQNTYIPTTGPSAIVSKFIIDGVQAELNPRPNTCRANLANEIRECFKTLKKEMDKKGKEFTVDFSRAVEIPKKNLMELDEKSRKFGCMPSKNIYNTVSGIKLANVDPEEYRIRAAGGHIHIGKGNNGLTRATVTKHEQTVELLDIIVGNTCVLIDRDKANIERRKVYGRAGEYRLPEHGLEYRTLSNFWLTSYPLMSLVFGLTRLAVQLMADDRHETYYKAFTSAVKSNNIHTAINNNDFDLATENFSAIESLIMEVSNENSRHAINKANMKEFYYFIDIIQKHGMEYWFPQDPMAHWTSLGDCHNGGFFDFLLGPVKTDMLKKPKDMTYVNIDKSGKIIAA